MQVHAHAQNGGYFFKLLQKKCSWIASFCCQLQVRKVIFSFLCAHDKIVVGLILEIVFWCSQAVKKLAKNSGGRTWAALSSFVASISLYHFDCPPKRTSNWLYQETYPTVPHSPLTQNFETPKMMEYHLQVRYYSFPYSYTKSHAWCLCPLRHIADWGYHSQSWFTPL